MSVPKRKAQKSLNQSYLSQASNSENLRECCIFKNNALAQINNNIAVNGHHNNGSQSKSSRKQQIFQSNSTKKRTTCVTNTKIDKSQNKITGSVKQNEKSKENKMLNYVGLSKILDQRNSVISSQQKQIQNLKATLQKVRKQLELTRVDFERRKVDDVALLKRQQRDNQDNIKQLQILRVGMKQLKNKIQGLQHQKLQLQKKCNQYFSQNQQITIKLATLKQQYTSKLPTQQTVLSLKHELDVLKQQAKATKQLQLQKVTLEQRCRSLQRKINQYILRYNQIQTQHNEMQIKYYRAQKQNDDLKMELEQILVQKKGLTRILQEQRRCSAEMVEKWRSRIGRLQERDISYGGTSRTGENMLAIKQMQDRCARLQTIKVLQQQINTYQQQIQTLSQKLETVSQQLSSLSIKYTTATQTKSQQQLSFQSILETSDLKIHALQEQLAKNAKIYEIQKSKLEEEVKNGHGKFVQLQKRLKESLDIGLGQVRELKDLEEKKQMENNTYIVTIKQKDKIINGLQQKAIKMSQDLRHSVQNLKMRSKSIQQNEQTIQTLRKQITQLQSRISSFEKHQKQNRNNLQQKAHQLINTKLQLQLAQTQLNQTKKQYQSTLSQLNNIQQAQNQYTKHQLILRDKLNILQSNLQVNHSKFDQSQKQLQMKKLQINKLENIVNKTNVQLKQIKVILNEYKQKIQSCNMVIEQSQNKMQAQLYMEKQNKLKYQQQIKYYRTKSQDNFKEVVEQSHRICALQKQLTQLSNKNTEIVLANNKLQQKVQMSMNENYGKQTQLVLKIQGLIKQNRWQSQENQKMSANIKDFHNKISESELFRIQLQNRISLMEQQFNKLRKYHRQTVQNTHNTYITQIQELQRRYQQSNKSKLQLQIQKLQLQNKILQTMQSTNQLQRKMQHKQQIILQHEQTISQKQTQIDKLVKMRNIIQNQQFIKLKQYNLRLLQQIQENSVQFNKTYLQLRDQADQCQKYRSFINSLEKQMSQVRTKNMELSSQIQRNKMSTMQQIQQSSKMISDLRLHASNCEEKVRSQSQQLNVWIQRYENNDKELKKIQQECSKFSRSFLQESHRKNKQNSRQIDNYRMQIKLLQEQNMNLQKIMDKQLGKRKLIIQQLIHEKKLLYDQIEHQ